MELCAVRFSQNNTDMMKKVNYTLLIYFSNTLQ